MKPTALSLSLLCSLTAAGLAGCAAEGDPDEMACEGDKCDDLDKPDSAVPDSPCDGVMVDKSGRDHEKVAGRLHDPLAVAVLQAGDDCPVTFQDIVAKLQVNDAADCSNTNGMLTRAISETVCSGSGTCSSASMAAASSNSPSANGRFSAFITR